MVVFPGRITRRLVAGRRNNIGIRKAGGVGFKHAAHFVPDSAETLHHFLFAAAGFRRVKEGPVAAVKLAGKNRTGLVGVAAHGDDGVNGLVHKFLQMFRAMAGNIHADFRHHLDGERMDLSGGIGTSALDVRQFAQCGAQKAFADMAAAGVAGAENENGWFESFIHGCRFVV
jgi:hypothetical protein